MAEFKVSTDLSVVRGLQITANFDELKAELTQKVESYRQMVVTPETTAAAKADLANLRRVQKNIDEVRLAWKREYMIPWDEFEAKCKELKAVLDGGISNLDTQIKGFEEAEANAKLDELHAFFDGLLTDETRDFADWEKIKNPRWKNKTYDPVQARNEIHMAVAEVERSLAALRGYPEPYKSSMLVKYKETGRLTDAINVYTLTKQREAAEAERQRQREEAARRATEEAERQKAEAAAQAARAAQELSDSLQGQMTRAAAENAAQGNESGETAAPTPTQRQNPLRKVVEFRVTADSASAKALGAFLRGNGIEYEILRFRNEGDERWTVPAKR